MVKSSAMLHSIFLSGMNNPLMLNNLIGKKVVKQQANTYSQRNVCRSL